MSRYCCPDCQDHIMLDEGLNCIVCKGRYVWLSIKEYNQLKEIIRKEKEQNAKETTKNN